MNYSRFNELHRIKDLYRNGSIPMLPSAPNPELLKKASKIPMAKEKVLNQSLAKLVKRPSKLYSVLLTEKDLRIFSEALEQKMYAEEEEKKRSSLGKKLAIGAGVAATVGAGLWAGNKGYLGKNVQAGIKTAGAGLNSMWNKTKTAATNMGNKVGDKFNQIKTNLPQTSTPSQPAAQ